MLKNALQPDCSITQPALTIVVPCYNEEAVIEETAGQIDAVLEDLIVRGKVAPRSQLIFDDDGSRDRTWFLIQREMASRPRVGGIKLSRNCGHQNAILAGLMLVEGDAVITVDADLQDDLHAIEKMLAEYGVGCDIVYGVRKERVSDTMFKRSTARLFYSLMMCCGVDLIYDHADFRLMSRRAIEALRQFKEVNLFLRGLVPLLGFRTSTVTYDRKPRLAGETKYPLRKMIRFSLEGITSFSAVPLQAITALGVLIFSGTILMGAWVLWVALMSERAVPGWASTVLPLTLLSGVQILCLGIIGEYLARIYIETKARPRFFAEEVIAPATAREAEAFQEAAGAAHLRSA